MEMIERTSDSEDQNAQVIPDDAANAKATFVKPKLTFVAPKLVYHGGVAEITTGVGGDISPGT